MQDVCEHLDFYKMCLWSLRICAIFVDVAALTKEVSVRSIPVWELLLVEDTKNGERTSYFPFTVSATRNFAYLNKEEKERFSSPLEK